MAVFPEASSQLRPSANNGLYLSLAAMIFFFGASGWIAYSNSQTLRDNTTLLTRSQNILLNLSELLSLAKDAETGQRGYIITGNAEYLEPYNTAVARIKEKLADVQQLLAGSLKQEAKLAALRKRIDLKLQELAETIELRRTQGFAQTQEIVITNRGKRAMDDIRNQVDEMQLEEQQLRNERLLEMENAYRISIVSGLLTGLLGVLLSFAVTYLLRRSLLNRKRQEWLHTSQIQLSQVIAGEQKVTTLAQKILTFLTDYLGAQAGALYVEVGEYQRVATAGVPANATIPESFSAGDGLLGQAVKQQRIIRCNDVPPSQLPIGSALTTSTPRHLLIVPFLVEGNAQGVVELGFMHPINEAQVELLERVSQTLASAIRSVKYREHLQELLAETQRQAQELQLQSEELRVTNEEFEVQARALRESQSQLQVQQSELVQAGQDKSDFLSKVKQELWAPLNSSVILAKQLAANTTGNLSAEQIQSAQSIQHTGNSLLAALNEFLAT